MRGELGKRGQFQQVVTGHRFQRLPGFAPRRKATLDYKSPEACFPEHQRHPGAGRFACSSAIEKNVLVVCQLGKFHRQMVGFDPD
jgi:hypothetical protein